MTVHDFKQSLAESHAQEDAPWWEPVYRRAFPAFHSMMSVRCDGWAQRGGIDRVINLKSGRVVTVDEKVRFRSYGDILLERWSVREKQVPGWAQKDLACDFIAYAFVPDRRCYMIPALLLRTAWLQNGRQWIQQAEANEGGFQIVEAKNTTYTTESVAVPIPVFLRAIQSAQIIEWQECAEAAA